MDWVGKGRGKRGDWAYVCSVDWRRGLHTANGGIGLVGEDSWCRREWGMVGELEGEEKVGLRYVV